MSGVKFCCFFAKYVSEWVKNRGWGGKRIESNVETGAKNPARVRKTLKKIREKKSCSSHLLARKVDAHSPLPDQVRRHLVLVARHAGDDHVADGQALLQIPSLEIPDLVLLLLQPAAATELLHAGHVNRVNLCAIIRQQRRKRPSHNLAAVDDRDPAPEKPLAVVQERVVNPQMLEDFNASQRRAGQDRLLQVVRRVEEADVLVQVADELGAQALDVLVHAQRPLQRAVALRVEDRVVDDDAVDGVVDVGFAELVFQRLAVDFAQREVEAVFAAGLARPFGVHSRGRVGVGQEAVQVWFAVEFEEVLLDFGAEGFGDRGGQDDFARVCRGRGVGGCHFGDFYYVSLF